MLQPILKTERCEQKQTAQEWSAKARRMSSETIEVCGDQAGMAETAELAQRVSASFISCQNISLLAFR